MNDIHARRAIPNASILLDRTAKSEPGPYSSEDLNCPRGPYGLRGDLRSLRSLANRVAALQPLDRRGSPVLAN